MRISKFLPLLCVNLLLAAPAMADSYDYSRGNPDQPLPINQPPGQPYAQNYTYGRNGNYNNYSTDYTSPNAEQPLPNGPAEGAAARERENHHLGNHNSPPRDRMEDRPSGDE